MSDIVPGKNVVVYIYDGGVWKLYACARSCRLTINTEFIETSVSGHGVDATFIPTKNSCEGTLDGVMSLEAGGDLNYDALQAMQVTHQLLLTRYQRTSRAGMIYISELSFYIASSTDTGSYDDVNTFSIELKGTGIITTVLTPTTPPTGTGAVYRYDYTASGGESFFINTLLANKFILEANKDGLGFKVILSGTPVEKEMKYTIGSGRFDWSVPFEPSEKAYIIYQDL